MWVGDVVADRFVIERPIGSGGMGSVFLATDRLHGASVALKVLDLVDERSVERFRGEARVLSELTHPAIVRYVAHGEAAGRPFLAMELLQGEDLAARLSRSPVTPAEGLTIVRQAASALAHAHARGVVHRDVKPSNLFLVRGAVERVKVLDFGIARTNLLTRSGPSSASVLGTMGYMAPEHTIDSGDVDARADVFSLGCVLFECVTGRRAFPGDHPASILAKVLTDDLPPISKLRPDLGRALDVLVARMLCKQPGGRPDDAQAVLREIDEIGVPPGAEALPAVERLTRSERRVVCVIGCDPTRGLQPPREAPHDPIKLRNLAVRFGAEAVQLGEMRDVLVVSSDLPASDQVALGARCALELKRERPGHIVVLATGWCETTAAAPIGPVIDRAASLRRALNSEALTGIAIDDVTSGLLGARFEVRILDGRPLLMGERGSEAPRLLLGRTTPFVGRDGDMNILEAILRECVEERIPRAVLVTAPPGSGKSRLRQEFVAKIRDMFAGRVVMAQADSMSAGSPFVLARQLVRGTTGLSATDSPAVHCDGLTARLNGRMAPSKAGVCAEFICELLGTPVDAEPSPILRAARADPRLLSEWLRTSFIDWLEIEAVDPFLMIIEDMHWGDAATLAYIDRVLKNRNVPLMVLALARPEVHETFPRLWAGNVSEIQLSGLGQRAAERLVRNALPNADDNSVARIVGLADGNAFYLEELIRAVAEGNGDALPETVSAMVRARLERIASSERHVLRVASVFGERFSLGGVQALVGGACDVPSSLAHLEEQEIVTRTREGLHNDPDYAFGHALVRDAAYATFVDEDRRRAHRLAAEWLEGIVGTDPVAMADHLEQGGEPERAVRWLVRAAEAAYDGGSAAVALLLAERAVPHATGHELGILKTIAGVSEGAQGRLDAALASLREAMPLLPIGGRYWFIAATNTSYFGAMAGVRSATEDLARAVADVPPISSNGGLYAWSCARVVLAHSMNGLPDKASTFLKRLEAVASGQTASEPSFTGWLAMARVYAAVYAKPVDVPGALRSARHAVKIFELVRDDLATANARFWEAVGLFSVGRASELEATVERGLLIGRRSGNAFITQHLEMLRWMSIARSGDGAEAADPLAQLARAPLPTVAGTAQSNVAYALMAAGDLAGAERAAKEGLAKSTGMTVLEAQAQAVLAAVHMASGRVQDALAAADTALALPVMGFPRHLDECELIRAEALMAVGRTEDALAAIQAARAHVLGTAASLDDEDRSSYLTQVRASVRILDLAREWLGNV